MDEIKFTNKDSIIEFSCNGKLGFLIIGRSQSSLLPTHMLHSHRKEQRTSPRLPQIRT